MSQDNLTHWLISTRGETCFSFNPMTAATDFLKREAMVSAETVLCCNRVGAALGVLRGDGGESRLRPLVAPRR